MSTRLVKKETIVFVHAHMFKCAYVDGLKQMDGLNQWQHAFVLTRHAYACVIRILFLHELGDAVL